MTHLDKVDLGKRIVAPGFLNVKDRDDVFVVKVSQQLHFS